MEDTREKKKFEVRYVAMDGDIVWTEVEAYDEGDAFFVVLDNDCGGSNGILKLIDATER